MSNSNKKTSSKESRRTSGFTFRSRLIWNNVLLVALTLVGTTLIAFNRAGQSSAFLTDELAQSVRSSTEAEIRESAQDHANELDQFFGSVKDDMATMGEVIESLLAQEAVLNTNAYWDGRGVMSQLPKGSWDNPNEEPGSVFIPARPEIPETIYSELNAIKQMDFIAPSILQENPDIIAVYFGSRQGATLYYPNIDLAAIVPPDFDVTGRPWYLAAAPAQNPDGRITWSVPYEDAALHGLVVTSSMPVFDSSGTFRGVVAIDLQLIKISDLVSSIHIGETGYAFLLDGEGRLIAVTDAGLSDFGLSREDVQGGEALPSILSKVPIDLFQTLVKMTTNQTGLRTILLNGEEKYIAYRPIPSIGYSLGVVVPVEEMQTVLHRTMQRTEEQTRNTLLQIGGAILVLLALSVLISRWLGTSLASPLVELTETAERLSGGDLNAVSGIRSRDEFGVLAGTFNTMAESLRGMITSLEQRVLERTADLTQATRISEKRAKELKTVSDVARAVSTEVNLETLLTLVTNLVSEQFGFYHVGVFLMDNVSKYAVLRASNSRGGKRMIERGHKLQVGQVGMVGHVAATAEPRIALDVGDDAVFFNNPDLPQTRSEMALPLRLRGRIIGVLDVQSVEPNAFTQADAETLGILADQTAVAIDNARLLDETQKALSEAQTLYGEYIGRAWERKRAQTSIGYHQSPFGGKLLTEPVEWEEAQTAVASGKTLAIEAAAQDNVAALAVPIRLHNRIIGVIDIRSTDAARRWKEEEIAVIEATADRLALALENARLFEETSRRAAREHAVADITSKIRQTNDPQAMIRTAIEELQSALGVTRVEIVPQIVPTEPPDDGHHQGGG